ncbi:MAG: DUF3526 domain-containing protein [Polyangiales bacterium]
MSASSRIVWYTARHEMVRARRRHTFGLSLGIVTLLLGAAFALEGQRQTAEASQRHALQELVTERFKDQPDRHPHRMAHYGSFAFRPPSPLSFFEPGVMPFTGNALYLEAHKRNLPSFSPATQASELVRFGRPTAAFVLQLLLPLLIFVMTFDSIAGEREQGTWRLALSQGASARALLLGKVLGHAALAIAWVLPIASVAIAVRLALGVGFPSGDTLLRAGLLGLAYALYLGLCAVIGVVVSSLHTRAHHALTTLLCVWIASFIVVPRAAAELAVRSHPMPARSQMEADLFSRIHGVDNGHGKNSPEAQALAQRTLAQYGVSRIEDLPININGLRAQAGEEHTSRLYDQYYAGLYAIQREQEALMLRFGVVSPLLLLRSVSMTLAGSDTHEFAAFLEQAEAHRAAFINKLNDVHAKHLQYAESDNLQRASHEHWLDYEAFVYRQPGLSQASPLLWASGLGLALFCAVLILLAARGTRRALERT